MLAGAHKQFKQAQALIHKSDSSQGFQGQWGASVGEELRTASDPMYAASFPRPRTAAELVGGICSRPSGESSPLVAARTQLAMSSEVLYAR